ncbi:hypothetical protein E5347_13375 [Clostridium sartagoforme]|uniref:Uncharacterized protein n=2 Tax=Clostridium TaxID=1485 RepID=A0A4S2DGG5_9CLOT|nr:2-keto-3-deoxygluconate permease [Clostridium sartagoforme]MBS5939951.1 2-keto-3-deoxygluconate permease [Clostridium sp.]TGY41157.1 hypothetical protein E5347_13375 [Clostridium sartagoforme]
MGICFGSSINFILALKAGVSGIILTAIFYLISLLPLLLIDRKIIKRPGYVSSTMSQIALASIITSIMTPMIIKYIVKK